MWNLFVSLVNCHRYQAVWYRVLRTSPSALQIYRLSMSNDYYKRTLKVCLLLVMRSTSVWWLFWTLKWAKEPWRWCSPHQFFRPGPGHTKCQVALVPLSSYPMLCHFPLLIWCPSLRRYFVFQQSPGQWGAHMTVDGITRFMGNIP